MQIDHKEVLTAMAELELPTISSEIALKITAKRLGVPVTELNGHNDKVRSRVHERLQELEQVDAVTKRRFRANDRIHLYDLPRADRQNPGSIENRERLAKNRVKAL